MHDGKQRPALQSPAPRTPRPRRPGLLGATPLPRRRAPSPPQALAAVGDPEPFTPGAAGRTPVRGDQGALKCNPGPCPPIVVGPANQRPGSVIKGLKEGVPELSVLQSEVLLSVGGSGEKAPRILEPRRVPRVRRCAGTGTVKAGTRVRETTGSVRTPALKRFSNTRFTRQNRC